MINVNTMSYSRTKLAAAIVLALSSATASAEMFELGGGANNFTMLTPAGGRVGGTNDVTVMWDGTFNDSVATAVTNMTISSPTEFFNALWSAHDVQVFGPGSYTFEACLDDGSKIGTTPCGNPNYDPTDLSTITNPLTMNVAEGQVGVHMLFDWNGSNNIDVVNVWDMNAVWGYGPNDGTNTSVLEVGVDYLICSALPNEAGCDQVLADAQALFDTEWLFASTDVNGNGIPGHGMVDGPFVGFNANFNVSAVPVPAAAWLMGSGLLGLLGMARRKKS